VNTTRHCSWAQLYLNNGNAAFDQANTYLELNGLKSDDAPYAIITGYLGLRKAGKPAEAKAFLDNWIKQVGPDDWTTKTLKYFNGNLTQAQYLGAAKDNDQLTEAHAYIGEAQMLARTPAQAKIHFNWVVQNGNKNFVEYDLAIAELKNASKAVSTPTVKRPVTRRGRP
jgi:lipoprotein NlpI